jgi:crotonobetainyl-CoA:carnitine CoA-transferase CaiB-like acyl-CoA transferase
VLEPVIRPDRGRIAVADRALADLTVVECGVGSAGAFAAKAFADLGADVIKVEPPDGDPGRRTGPFPGDVPHPEQSGHFLYLNANKRGVTLDIESAGDRDRLSRLLDRADILISDMAPPRLDRLGLDGASLQARHPSLIAVLISPFGQTGPYRDYAGTDLIAWHMGGTGYGTPFNAITEPSTQPPLRGGDTQADFLAGWTAAASAMAAVFQRGRSGMGQIVDISAMEAVANMVRAGFALFSYDRRSLPEARHKAGSPWIYPCKDGYISTSTLRDHWWEELKDLMGRPAWADDPSFADVASRRRHADALDLLLGEWFGGHTRADLYPMLVSRGIPCFPVNAIDEVLRSPHYRDRGFFVTQEHPVAGAITQPGPAIRLFGTPWQLRRPAPLLGQHNAELSDLTRFAALTAPPSLARKGESSATSVELGTPFPAREGGAVSAANRVRSLPLAGVRVLDFGWILSVPHCTAWLGTLGAEVIRVESLTRLDLGRAGITGCADGIPGPNRSASFNGLNYSKQSITLNLASPEGLALARDLVKVSDVVTENFATDVMDRLGLGYEALRAIKPDIIMLSGSTLGTSGPERDATGWGPNVCAYAGLPWISGYPDGPPVDLGGIWPDYMIGTAMVYAVLSALHHQRRTGEGQRIEVAMGEVVTTMIPEAVLDYTLNGRLRPRPGNRDAAMAPHGVYPCRGEDAWVAIAVATDAEWQALCRVIGCPGLADDPRLATTAGRQEHHDTIDHRIADWTRSRSPYEVMHTLQAAGIAAGPVLSVPDLMADPHLQARGFVVEMDHPEVGRRTVAGLPAKFSAMPELPYTPAPCLGEHNAAVFDGLLDLGRDELSRLQAGKVIY